MKTIQYFFFVAVATVLMAADCSNKDSEFYNDVFVTAPELVTVESSDVPEDQAVYVISQNQEGADLGRVVPILLCHRFACDDRIYHSRDPDY